MPQGSGTSRPPATCPTIRSRPTPGTVLGRRGVRPLSRPLYQAKAEFFKALAHPARVRVLELLSEREHSVSEMLPDVGIEAAHLSQQLSVLRKMNLVRSEERRVGKECRAGDGRT